ncbi:hypothetical protein FA95DRAFT_279972 [Auriscalpium vulgare]|uniref:Uncharacterized protein n=1 Tax=Auriscalpium vulgare TaxID=40419 RepID=A0ACB8S6E1_9AGAM|nr:hypothetical protein FA95DRAFT_279972 [Auriscalpium vulgare]
MCRWRLTRGVWADGCRPMSSWSSPARIALTTMLSRLVPVYRQRYRELRTPHDSPVDRQPHRLLDMPPPGTLTTVAHGGHSDLHFGTCLRRNTHAAILRSLQLTGGRTSEALRGTAEGRHAGTSDAFYSRPPAWTSVASSHLANVRLISASPVLSPAFTCQHFAMAGLGGGAQQPRHHAQSIRSLCKMEMFYSVDSHGVAPWRSTMQRTYHFAAANC